MEKRKTKTIGIIFAIIAVSVFTLAIPSIAPESSNTPVTTEPGEGIQIEELQQWIYDQGYNYTVAENWITQLSPEERGALCGYKRMEAPTEPLPENISFILDMPKTKLETKEFGLPSSYDAMALGYVTPVKDQAACGSCWIFGAVADFESDVLINESQTFDFSEQEVGDCNIWSNEGGYNFCNGGDELMTTNYFTKYGSADEACHPYAATPGTCRDCPLLKNVNNWRIITGADGNDLSYVNTIKNAILTYGPVQSTIYASGPGFQTYSSGVYEYWGPWTPNHLIEIIGWDDTKVHSHGTGAWLIKNSWGTDWGTLGPYPGCAWVAYGAANLGDDTSAISGYKNPDDIIFYHDECGNRLWCYGDNQPTAYGAVRFTPSQNLTLTAVDFWSVDANMQYEIKIFDTLNTYPTYYTFSNQLGTTQTGTTNESGYYSIPLNTPVQLVSGNDFIVQVKITTTGWGYPIPIDYYTESWLPAWSGIATFSGESYYSLAGTQFEKPYDSYLDKYFDVGIRARAQEAPAPTPTLQVSVSEIPDPVISGGTSQVTVHVTSSADGLPVQGASVTVSTTCGSVTPSSGTTDSNGDFKPTYLAPTVTSPTTCTISATASKTGYTSGSGSDTITVNPPGGATLVKINNASAPSGGSATTPIMMNITDPTGLGAATINLSYNQSVCVVIAVGNSSFDSLTSSHPWTNTSGYVRMVASQTGATGVGPGLITFADITLKAVGSFGQESRLNLSIETLKNNSGVSVPYTVTNGTFKIGVKGDYSGDGVKDSWDCTYLARHLAGIPGYETLHAGDISGDGVVDSWDCTYLARHLAGIPGYEDP